MTKDTAQSTGIAAAMAQPEMDPATINPAIAAEIDTLGNRQVRGYVTGVAGVGVSLMLEGVAWASYASAQAPYDLPQNFESDKIAGVTFGVIGGLMLAGAITASVRGYFAGRRAAQLQRQLNPPDMRIAYGPKDLGQPDMRVAYSRWQSSAH